MVFDAAKDMVLPSPKKETRETRRIQYQCLNPRCRAVDFFEDFTTMPAPQVLQCWKCGNGRGLKNHREMMDQRRGMFPVQQVPDIHEVPPSGSQPS